jgi:hypothetical protein
MILAWLLSVAGEVTHAISMGRWGLDGKKGIVRYRPPPGLIVVVQFKKRRSEEDMKLVIVKTCGRRSLVVMVAAVIMLGQARPMAAQSSKTKPVDPTTITADSATPVPGTDPQVLTTADPRLANAKELTLNPVLKGCYLEINGTDRRPLLVSPDWCASLHLALIYAHSRKDLFHLLTYLSMGDQLEYRLITDESNTLKVGYESDSGATPIRDIRAKLSSATCEHIEFFGLHTYCFNEIPGIKRKNLRYLIPVLTVMVYTGDLRFIHPVENQTTSAFEFGRKHEIRIFDGSKPDHIEGWYELQGGGRNFLYNRDFEVCPDSSKKAHARPNNGFNNIFICRAMLPDLDKAEYENRMQRDQVDWMTVYFHEFNHPPMKYLVDNYTKLGVEGHLGVHCTYPDGNGYLHQPVADWSTKSVYGAHMDLRFALSTDTRISCWHRRYMFNKAIENLRCNICQKHCPNYQQYNVCTAGPPAHYLQGQFPQCQVKDPSYRPDLVAHDPDFVCPPERLQPASEADFNLAQEKINNP